MKSHINKSEQTQTLRKAKYSKCFYMIQWKIIYTKLDLNEHFEKVENETKTFLQCENIEPNNYCIIKVDDYDEIVNKTRRSCPGPDKISYNILKRLPKGIKAYIRLLITSSINKFYVPTTWKKSKVKMLPKPNKNKEDAEIYRTIRLTNCFAKRCKTAVKKFCPSALWKQWCLRWKAKCV